MLKAKTDSSSPDEYVDLCVYADGSFAPSAKTGGWGFAAFNFDIEIMATSGKVASGDNNTAELMAVLMALRWIGAQTTPAAVTLFSDSAYVVRGCNEWRFAWRSYSWRRKSSGGRGRLRDIPNARIWQDVDRELQALPHVKVSWCKGHASDVGNLRADALAESGRRMSSLVIGTPRLPDCDDALSRQSFRSTENMGIKSLARSRTP